MAGSVRHIARATSLQGPASGNALSVVAIPQRSSLSIEKSVSSPSLATLAYTFDVTNTGDTTLDGVYVVDDRIPTSAIDCGASAGIPVTIETGITVSCSAAYTITAADRKFFERFPARRHRLRLAARPEIEAAGIISGAPKPFRPHPDVAHYVAVKWIATGVRFRVFVLGPAGAEADVNEEIARAIYEETAASNPRVREIEHSLQQAAEARSS